uniref:Plasminogen receptor (KT) n=1 Tax=Timema tahoe TaxID=61484 RepID=A0A7R9P0A1_9NEOP|nr:unnamed protein product [Timema tahoe]
MKPALSSVSEMSVYEMTFLTDFEFHSHNIIIKQNMNTVLNGMVLSATRETPRGGDHVLFLMESFIFGRPPCLLLGALSAERSWAGLPLPPPHTTPGQALSLVERQIQMQNQMRERMVSMQVARARELLYWFGSFYILAALGMIAGFRRTRKPGVLAPLLPLSFIGGYQADMAYGNKLHRIRGEAENIMQYEMDLLELPCGLPSASSIDQARLDNDEKKKLHPAVPPI